MPPFLCLKAVSASDLHKIGGYHAKIGLAANRRSGNVEEETQMPRVAYLAIRERIKSDGGVLPFLRSHLDLVLPFLLTLLAVTLCIVFALPPVFSD